MQRGNVSHAKAQRYEEMTENEIGKIVVGSSVHLHMEIGPGLLEKGRCVKRCKNF